MLCDVMVTLSYFFLRWQYEYQLCVCVCVCLYVLSVYAYTPVR